MLEILPRRKAPQAKQPHSRRSARRCSFENQGVLVRPLRCWSAERRHPKITRTSVGGASSRAWASRMGKGANSSACASSSALLIGFFGARPAARYADSTTPSPLTDTGHDGPLEHVVVRDGRQRRDPEEHARAKRVFHLHEEPVMIGWSGIRSSGAFVARKEASKCSSEGRLVATSVVERCAELVDRQRQPFRQSEPAAKGGNVRLKIQPGRAGKPGAWGKANSVGSRRAISAVRSSVSCVVAEMQRRRVSARTATRCAGPQTRRSRKRDRGRETQTPNQTRPDQCVSAAFMEEAKCSCCSIKAAVSPALLFYSGLYAPAGEASTDSPRSPPCPVG